MEKLTTKTKNHNEVGKKKTTAESQSYLCGSFLVLSTGIVDSDEGRIGHDETVLSDSALLEVVEICTYKSDILSSAAQGQHASHR